MFAWSYIDKFGNVLWALFFFILVLYTFSFFFVVYWFLKKLSKYAIEDCYRMFSSFVLFIIVWNCKNFIIGCVHSVNFDNYDLQINLITATELIVCIILILFQLVYSNFRQKLLCYILGLESIYIALFNTTLYIDYKIRVNFG